MKKPFLVIKVIRYLGVVVLVILVMSTTECNNQTTSTPSNKGTEISEINTTWKVFLDSYMKENPDVKDLTQINT